MYLIHWPNPANMRDNWAELNSESWRAMEEAVKAGKIRAIGVSNFRKRHLDALMENAEIKPVVNQIFLNPSDLQPEVVAENKKYDMLNEAYSPLGTGGLLGNDVVKEVAVNYGKSPAQVLIRWSLQHGFYHFLSQFTQNTSRQMQKYLILKLVLKIWLSLMDYMV